MKEETTTVTVFMPKKLRDAIRAQGEKEGRKLSQHIRFVMERSLKEAQK